MTPEQQQAVVERLLALMDRDETDMVATDMAADPRRYVAAHDYDLEHKSIFRRLPVVVAPAASVARPGDFVTDTRYGVPLLITRDRDGRLHAFLNACTHRGARLVGEESGCGRHAFACSYHGWAFANDGRLRHITDSASFPNTNPADHDLVRLPVGEAGGWIWVQLDPQGSLDLDSYLGDLQPELDGWNMHEYRVFRTRERAFAGNWKAAIENLMEAYHVPYAHPETVHAVMSQVMLVDRYGWHQRFVVAGQDLRKLASVSRHRWRLRGSAGVGYFLFPNTVVAVQPDHILWQRVYPTGPQSAVYAFSLLVPETAAGDDWQPIWDRAFAKTDRVLDEDAAVTETVSRGLATGWLPELRLGRHELAIQGFHGALDAAIREAGESRPGR